MDPTSESETTQDDLQIMSTSMSSIVYYEGKACETRSGLNEAEVKETKSEMTHAADRVREVYASGVPFFTKRAIADLAGQLDQARKHHKQGSASEGDTREMVFSLQGLYGNTVEIENEVGRAWPKGGVIEQVMVDFIIDYQTYQHLIVGNTDPDRYSPEVAYCPLRVHYLARERDETTHEVFPEPSGQSLEATQEAFDAGIKAWEDSDDCKRIKAALMTSTIPDKITNVVAFGCSTMSDHEVDEQSITQHALILTIRNFLQKKNPAAYGKIVCYAQDPVYSDVDRAVLEGAGVHILEDPHGFLEVDDSSVVISFAPDVPVRQIVADISRPAIMIWNKVTPEEEMLESWSKGWEDRTFESVEELEGNICDPESSRLREMVQNDYVEIGELSEDAFGDSCVYVRRC